MSKSALLFALAACLAGIAGGYVAGRSGGDPILTNDRPVPDPRRPAAPHPAATAAPPGTPGPRSLPPLPEAEDLSGDGVIAGTVKSAAGVPLPGAVVRAVPQGSNGAPRPRNRQSTGVPEDPALEQVAARAVESARRSRARRREAVTDSEGVFRLDGLADRNWRLSAYAEGYRFDRRGSTRAAPGDEVRLVGVPVLEATLRVTLPDGRQPEKAKVWVRSGGSGRSYIWTPEDDWLELAPGLRRLTVSAGEFAEYRSGEIVLTVREDVSPGVIDCPLKESAGICGKVSVPAESENVMIRVLARRVRTAADADPESLMKRFEQETGEHYNRWRSEEPTYCLLNLAAGAWLVGLSTDYRSIDDHAVVQVGDGMTRRDLTVPAPDTHDALEVTVLSPEGRPIDRVRFDAGVRQEGRSRGLSIQATRGKDGSWLVKGLTDPGDGERWLRVHHAEYGWKEVPYSPGAGAGLTIRFESPATLTIRIEGYEGSGYEGRLTVSSGNRGPPFGVVRARAGIDAQGEATLGPLSPGVHEFLLSLRHNRRTSVIARETVTVVSGPNEHRIALPKLYDLTVVLPGEGARGTASLSPRLAKPLDHRMTPVSAAGRWVEIVDGRATFTEVPAGDYRLQVRGTPSGEMEVSIPGTSVLEFDPPIHNAMRVRITGEGALSRAGFRDGDLIVAVDGEEFRDERHMSALLAVARARRAKVSVLRGDRTLELEVDPDAWSDGGRLEPATR